MWTYPQWNYVTKCNDKNNNVNRWSLYFVLFGIYFGVYCSFLNVIRNSTIIVYLYLFEIKKKKKRRNDDEENTDADRDQRRAAVYTSRMKREIAWCEWIPLKLNGFKVYPSFIRFGHFSRSTLCPFPVASPPHPRRPGPPSAADTRSHRSFFYTPGKSSQRLARRDAVSWATVLDRFRQMAVSIKAQ